MARLARTVCLGLAFSALSSCRASGRCPTIVRRGSSRELPAVPGQPGQGSRGATEVSVPPVASAAARREGRGGAPPAAPAVSRRAGRARSTSTGSPIYTRMQRLTNGQWERAVTDVLRFAAPANLSQGFSMPAAAAATDFANNEKRLSSTRRPRSTSRLASEAAAALATGTPDALARLYAGADAAGFVRTFGRRAFRRPLTADEESEVPGRLRDRRNDSTARASRTGPPSSSARCCSRRSSCTAPSSGRRARRWTATRSPRSFRSGCSARRPATSCWMPPRPARSIRRRARERGARDAGTARGRRASCATFTGSSTGWTLLRRRRPGRRARRREIRAGGDLGIGSSTPSSRTARVCARS